MGITKHRSSSTAIASSSSASSSSSGSDSGSTDRRGSRRHKSGSRKHRSRKERDRDEKTSKRGWKSSRRDEEEERKKKRRRRRERKHKRRSRRDEASSSDYSGSDEEDEDIKEKSEGVVRGILEKFPDVADDLKQLLQMVDSGQAVDVSGIPNRELVKLLKELFHSLKLNEADGLFLLPPKMTPTLATVGSFLKKQAKPSGTPISVAPENLQFSTLDQEHTEETEPQGRSDTSAPQRRRLIGPEMPSSELLAAAAELTEAEAAVRDGVLEGDDALFIGPPPPAVAAEAESANEAERFEEVGRIIGADIDKPYDVIGVNHRMSLENMKKRYWKLSLMVHPDKCSHPQAHQAFVMLNQAFKELQDPEKRKAIDEKIKIKEEEEAFKAELKSLREAAQWRRLQGISMEGDDVLLAEPEKLQVRDEWMTNLPPERKPGVSMQSKTSFCRAGKEGRGDTSMWTDDPLDRSAKAKQNYLEAYNKATALAATDDDKKRTDSVGDLVDKYNLSKRSKSLVEKHREESSQRRKKEKQKPKEKEDWIGQHPWKPWDREKDLTAGRQKVKLDSDGMAKGLASRFSSGSVQRNFL